MDFQCWLREAAGELSESESPKRDAEILLEHVTGKARTYAPGRRARVLVVTALRLGGNADPASRHRVSG